MLVPSVAFAEPPKTLDQLLEQVRQESTLENKANIEREEKFRQAQVNQEQLLNETLAILNKEEKRGVNLRRTYIFMKIKLPDKQKFWKPEQAHWENYMVLSGKLREMWTLL